MALCVFAINVFHAIDRERMEMELGLKFTRIADEFTSDFQLVKDRAGPLFLSRETESMFILTAHLRGYKRRNIKIGINDDATLIAIGGEKQVKETVMVGWQVSKKGTESKAFKKVFRIPAGVVLDKIKAKFNEDESTLTITMPKKVKGILGTSIEEIKENQELIKEGSANLQIVDERSPSSTIGTSNQATKGEDDKQENTEIDQKVDDLKNEKEEEGRQQNELEENCNEQEVVEGIPQSEVPHIETEIAEREVDMQENNNGVLDRTNDISEEEKVDEEKEGALAHVKEAEAEAGKVDKPREKRCKMCIPIVAGSTLLVSLVVFVIQIVRSKNQSSRRRD